MQKVLTIALLLSLSFHGLMKVGIQAWYEVNKDYVADVLCVNKDKPEMNCRGKCYLKKQLSKVKEAETSNEKEAPETAKKIELVQFILSEHHDYVIKYQKTISDKILFSRYLPYTGQDYHRDIFRPPIV